MPFKRSISRSVGKLLKTYSEDDQDTIRGEDVPYRPQLVPGGPVSVTVLMVGGGGAGGGIAGSADGGGGGAGEVKYGTITMGPGSYVFRAGDGGPAPGTGGPGENRTGTPTYISSPLFPTITAAGGGGGGTGSAGGWPGGSGGGGGGDGTPGPDPSNQPRGSSTAADATHPLYSLTGYGNPGGHGSEDGGGGGGAGGAGNTEPGGAATPGGAGQPFPAFAYPLIQPSIPSPLQPTFGPAVGPTGLYGGGGAAGGEGQDGTGGPGGGGGPGNAANPGIELTGGGGAGYEESNAGGNGGAGSIFLRIPNAASPGLTVPGDVTSNSSGSFTYYVFPGTTTTSYPVSFTGALVEGPGGSITTPVSATGGDTTSPDVGGYTVHEFTTPGPATFNVDSGDGDVEVFIVAGGGSGGCDNAGGGGAGGARTITGVPVAPGPYTIVVGAGGAAPTGTSDGDTGPYASPGNDSSAFGYILNGGGAGGSGAGQVGQDSPGNGSGGGGHSDVTSPDPAEDGGAGGAYGNNGGTGASGSGGGGGGAGGAGNNGHPLGGLGGPGVQNNWRTGSNQYYAAGGNGGNSNNSYNAQTSVNGIGGQSNPNSTSAASAGATNTGSGGGGHTHPSTGRGGAGGPGIVIIRYPNS
jgi:hypothetical protein